MAVDLVLLQPNDVPTWPDDTAPLTLTQLYLLPQQSPGRQNAKLIVADEKANKFVIDVPNDVLVSAIKKTFDNETVSPEFLKEVMAYFTQRFNWTITG